MIRNLSSVTEDRTERGRNVSPLLVYRTAPALHNANWPSSLGLLRRRSATPSGADTGLNGLQRGHLRRHSDARSRSCFRERPRPESRHLR
jgi:hypothetical protein